MFNISLRGPAGLASSSMTPPASSKTLIIVCAKSDKENHAIGESMIVEKSNFNGILVSDYLLDDLKSVD